MQRYLKTVSFGWRPCETILPVTLALEASAPVRNFFSSVATATTSPNVTSPPTLPGKVSTLTVSPGATRYCFPPDRMTAYIAPPDTTRKPRLYGCLWTSSTKRCGFVPAHPNQAKGETGVHSILRDSLERGVGV